VKVEGEFDECIILTRFTKKSLPSMCIYWIQQFVIVPQVGKNVKKVIIECVAMHRSLKFTYDLHNNNRRGFILERFFRFLISSFYYNDKMYDVQYFPNLTFFPT
jgi:hypothetical protein